MAYKLDENGDAILDANGDAILEQDTIAAPQPVQSQAKATTPEKSVSRTLAELFIPYSTKNENASMPIKALSLARDVTTMPLRAVAGVGNALGEAAAHPMSPSTGTAEAFHSGMSAPEAEVTRNLDQAGVSQTGWGTAGRIAAGVGAGLANDPTTLPSLYIGGPVGKSVLGTALKAGGAGALTGMISNGVRQLTEKPTGEFNPYELGLTTILGGGLGSGASALAAGLSKAGQIGSNNIAKIEKLGKILEDYNPYLKRADEATAKIAALKNPKVSPSVARENPTVYDEAIDEVARNPKFSKLTEEEGMETARGMSYRMDPLRTKVGAENARLDKIDALKEQMAVELNGINPNIKLKPQDISEPELANWVKVKQAELEAINEASEFKNVKMGNKVEDLRQKALGKSDIKFDFNDVISGIKYGSLGALTTGPKTALAGLAFGLGNKAVKSIAKTLPYKYPGAFVEGGKIAESIRGLVPPVTSTGTSKLIEAVNPRKKK